MMMMYHPINHRIIKEATLIGMYSVFMYTLVSYIIHNKIYILFIAGFMKHLLAYFIGIHTYYCNNGYACTTKSTKIFQQQQQQYSSKNNAIQLLIESVIEGFLFVILGTTIHFFIRNMFISMFLVGLLLHIVAEVLGIHAYFCENRCKIL